MRSGISFSIELPPFASGTWEVVRTIEDAKRGECYAIDVTLSDSIAPLRIVAKYSDEQYPNYTDEWHAVRSQNGGERAVEYFDASND